MILQGNITDMLAVVQNIETCVVSMINYSPRDENTYGHYIQMNLFAWSYHEVFGKRRYLVFQRISVIDGWGISCEISLRWMSLHLTDDKSTLVQVMAWCHQATSHYLSQWWPRSLSPNGITRPQLVKTQTIFWIIVISWSGICSSIPICTLNAIWMQCNGITHSGIALHSFMITFPSPLAFFIMYRNKHISLLHFTTFCILILMNVLNPTPKHYTPPPPPPTPTIMYTCKIIMYTCKIFMYTCKIIMYTCKIIMYA